MTGSPDKLSAPRTTTVRALRALAGRLKGHSKTAGHKVARWATFNHAGTAPPRLLRYSLVFVALLVISATYGVITARAQANFGPHDAQYQVTIDSAISVDAGPLGSLVLDSPMPLGLGIHATIGEIPDSLTSVEATTTLEALGQDLNGYIQFFAAPQETISVVAQLLVENAITRALAAAVVILALAVLTAYIAGHSRRKELTYRAARATWGLTAACVAVTVVAGTVLTQAAQREAQAIGGRESVVFAETALEGTKITGRLSTVVDEYGGMLLDVYNENEAFYQEANVALAHAFDLRNPLEEHSEKLILDSGKMDAEQRDLVTLLLVSDLHCNVGMAPLITTAAQQSGASIIMNGGDTTINGTDIERFCMDAFSKAVPGGAVMVQADGNHDSDITSKQASDAGVVVLDGEVVDVQGVRFLGDSDPRRTMIGQGSTLVGSETYADAGNRLSEVACATQEGPDVLLIHTPAVGSVTLSGGCAPYQFSGHMHTQDGPKLVGAGIQFVSGSSAGAVEGQPTIGPLNGKAEMTVLRFDRVSRTFVDRQLVTVNPDGSADVGPRIVFPTYAQLAPIVPESQESDFLGEFPSAGDLSDGQRPADGHEQSVGLEPADGQGQRVTDDSETGPEQSAGVEPEAEASDDGSNEPNATSQKSPTQGEN